MKKILLVLMLCLIFSKAQSIETKIIHSIQGEIITNVDIKNEFKYLIALNNGLKELDKEKILNISNESAIKETIKKIELLKNFKKIVIKQEYSDLLIKNVYLSLNLTSLDEFKLYLKNYDLSIDAIEKKLAIDVLWNELIIKKYTSQVTINEDQIKKEISKNNNIKSKEYELSEIIFEIKNKEEIKKKYKEMVLSIAEIGFKNTASLYSISNSAKIGGNIGWINENSLNNTIKKNIKDLSVGEISIPIILSNGILILKVIDTKDTETIIDLKAELTKAINYERERQLNQFSVIYYNKTKKNLGLDE